MKTRRLIREAIVKALKNKINLVGDRVFNNLSSNISIEQIPCISLFFKSEEVDRFEEAPKRYRKRVSLDIEIFAKGSDDLDLSNKLDDIADSVEILMEEDETMGKLLNKLELLSSNSNFEFDGQSPTGAIVMSYFLEYFVDVDADRCLNNLNSLNAKYSIGHHDESNDEINEAEDSVTLPPA